MIRTSGGAAPGKQLGLGHVYRTMNLASNLQNDEIHFMIEDYGSVKKILSEMNFFQITSIKKNLNVTLEILKMKKYIEKHKIDIVIFDVFNINQKLLNEIQKISKTVVISDLYKFNFKADLIVNGFVGFNNIIKKNSYKSKCLLGPTFQILNNNFCEKNIKKSKKFDLLVTFGGFDEKNIVEKFLKISKKYPKLKIKIILGPATKKNSIIKKYEKNNVSIIKYSSNMAKEMSQAKFGLCSGGITSYEFTSMGIPFGIICQVKHQLKTAKIFEQKKIAVNLGLIDNNMSKKIKKFLEELNDLQDSQKHQFNIGCGGKIVAKHIMEIKQKT